MELISRREAELREKNARQLISQKTIERLRKFTEQLETDPDLAKRLLNQTQFQQIVNQAYNGIL